MAPVTPPAHHPTRPPVVSQQEAGQDRRARWWTGGGRGHCGREFATGCCLDARDRCKTHSTRRQHKGGGKGGGNKPSQTADRPKPPPNKKPENKKANTDKKRTHKPFGLTEEETPNRTQKHRKKPGGKGHAVYRKSMKEKNASKWTVMSSVVPKTETRKQKNTEKTASNSSRRSQSTAEKNKSRHSLRSHPENRKKKIIRREPNPRNNIETTRPISCRATFGNTASFVSGVCLTAQDSILQPQKLAVHEGRRGPWDTPVTLEGRFRGERHREAPKGLPASPTAPKPQKPEKRP